MNQTIANEVNEIFELPHPQRHKEQGTVINVAVIRNGEVFNHKPATGWFSLVV